jgi:multidrug efflux pump subunit AcrB
VIAFELVRNLAMAMACVFLITLLLLVNLKLCLLVLLTVNLSLVDVVGVIYFMVMLCNTARKIYR